MCFFFFWPLLSLPHSQSSVCYLDKLDVDFSSHVVPQSIPDVDLHGVEC